MWNKKGKGKPSPSTDSLFGHGGTPEGKVQCDTNLRIDGGFTGEIRCSGTLTIGEQGRVHASIIAADVIIAGKVFGDVTAKHSLILTSTGCLHGSAAAGRLSIMEGGILNGLVEMEEPSTPEGANGSVWTAECAANAEDDFQQDGHAS
ncbi:bactofilin family protein [Paenibacillus sp. URB8-2]|uniref:bactofilin family protein n=1 Tax=Paenibacillus sp. URB8-2 TaxID=2741301 RepID=UPI0015BE9997|nr:polymer-forming cytoskeletal protein [Paenibacillus sp. URB8-2]BCG57642.1 hypothetical protein PUR_10670 [Paenibacillus sp. URB8-2]